MEEFTYALNKNQSGNHGKNIFTKYSEFLNYFDPSLHLEINLVTRSMDEEQFRRDTFLPLRGDDRDRYAEEMNQVVAEKALRGQNGLIREKYVTFCLHAENYQQAKEQLENRAADIADHFKRMGSSTRILSGIERLSLLQGIMRPKEEMSFSYDWLLAEDDLTTKDFISPSSYNWHPEHDDSRAVYRDRYQFGDKIGKTMYLRGIAPEMKNVQMALGGGAWIECCYGYGVCVNMSNAWMKSRGCHYFTYTSFSKQPDII